VITYIDSSLFLKLLFDEQGTLQAQMLWDSDPVLISSRLLRIEARATLARGKLDGRLTSQKSKIVAQLFDDLWARLTVVEISEQVAESACEIAESTRLRSLDAIHLASAVAVSADLFGSSDVQLCNAASDLGFAVFNPEAN
jgi:predicted nucleic acid-binding protein